MKILKGFEESIKFANDSYGWDASNECPDELWKKILGDGFHYWTLSGSIDHIQITKNQIKIYGRGCNGRSHDYILRV